MTLAVALLVVLGLGGLTALGLDGGRGSQPAAHRSGPAATVKVTRQTLVDAVTLPGELSYGTATPVASVATGTVTWLPEAGTVVRRGAALLRVDDQPIVLLYGPLPMYRQLSVGLRGDDVRQFERNLSALGYRGFVVDASYSADTAVAVRRWQKSLELPQTGAVDRGQVIYANNAARIAQRLVRVGANATGDVLSYTGITREVTVTTDRSKAAWAERGVRVELSTPSAKQAVGTVVDVNAPAATSEAQTSGAGATDDAVNAVVITMSFADQEALGTAAGALVNVRYIQHEQRDVLTVPVNALLALAEGGYGVEVVDNQGSHVVAVTVGLFADGRVEVRGSGLREGTLVGVPA